MLWFAEEDYGDHLVVDIRDATRATWTANIEYSHMRGLVDLSVESPVWVLQSADQSADDWPFLGEIPLFTQHIAGQHRWMQRVVLNSTWPVLYQMRARLTMSEPLRTAFFASVEERDVTDSNGFGPSDVFTAFQDEFAEAKKFGLTDFGSGPISLRELQRLFKEAKESLSQSGFVGAVENVKSSVRVSELPKDELDRLNSVIHEYLNAWTWSEKKDVVGSRWATLSRDVALRAILQLQERETDPDWREVLAEHLDVLRSAKQRGIAAAFERKLAPEVSDVPERLVQRLRQASNDDEYLYLVTRFATLRTLMLTRLLELFNAQRLSDKMAILEREKFLLLTPGAEIAASPQWYPDEKDLWHWHQDFIRQARTIGVLEAGRETLRKAAAEQANQAIDAFAQARTARRKRAVLEEHGAALGSAAGRDVLVARMQDRSDPHRMAVIELYDILCGRQA